MCSLQAQGIYIKIMCILHKQKEYGAILLKQKEKQNDSKCLDFAIKLGKLLPISVSELNKAITELVDEDVLQIDGDELQQKRMISDNKLSLIRAKAGSKGGKNSSFAKAKSKANTENENEDINENVNINIIEDIYKFWQKELNHPKAILTDDRKKKIKARLKEGFSEDRIKDAIQGIKNSKHHMGQNDNNMIYDDIELICRNGSNVDKFAEMNNIKQKFKGQSRYEEAML